LTAAAAETRKRDRPNWYGRRSGHRLRPARRKLVADLLPRVRVDPPADGGRLDLEAVFPAAASDVWLEVGFGGGEHLAAQARRNPGTGMIGCEPFVNGIASLLSIINEDEISNIRIYDDDARLLAGALPDASVGRVYALFPDPWPKRRHHRRRFINPENLDAVARLMKDGAELYFASDHMGYVSWVLEHMLRHPAFAWPARGPADWRAPPADWVETRYETKARARGAACVYLRFVRVPRA